ncbi:HEAT repeat domain-containing protein, partial [Nitrosopumilus sp.]|nr:HEAT repeat domain-containing protein [Nitrosopumilus sp.]
QIILRLNDDSIQVRGEAFNALLLNQNEISEILIYNLSSSNKNIKSFTSLVLANRNEKSAIPEIIKIVNNEHGMVRSCAIGSLGYLKAEKIRDIILKSLSDPNLEVIKSGLQTAIQTNIFVTEEKMKEISKKGDQQIENLLLKLKKISGPKGI